MDLQSIKLNTFLKILTIVGVFVFSFTLAHQALAGTAQMRVMNETHGSYSTGSTFSTEARAEPGDTLVFRMFYLGDTAATTLSVTLPADLTFADNTIILSGNSATAQTSGQTVTWTFTSISTEIITFKATVVSGQNLSTNHTLNVSFTSNGTPNSSDTATVKTGPILKTISVSTGLDSAEPITVALTGHGFTQTSDITSLVLMPGSLDMTTGGISVSGPDGNGYYTISNARIPFGTTVGTYYAVLTTTVSSTSLTTEQSANETVTFTVTDGTEPTLSSAPSYAHSTGVLTLTFNETINVSATDLSKITLYDASSGGNSQILTGATKSTTNASTISFTLTQSQINTVSGWGVAASNLYVQIAGSGIYDLSNNALVAQGSRTAITTWTKDTVQPTATVSYTQGSAATTSVKAGAVTITATFSEPISSTPNIAIDQPGAIDISATAMTGSGTTWTYTYTINAVADGTATVTLTNAPDYANNALSTVAGNTFVVDTFGPTPAITNLAGAASGQTAANFSWTPTYTASDFSTYKFYYRTMTGVTSANGIEINKNSSGYSNLGTAATNSLGLTGLTAATRYFGVIYICDTADNCSAISNETEAQTNSQAVISVPSSGGGGGGSTATTPSTASSAGTITASGGAITTNISGGSSATVTIPANTTSGTLTVSEATTAEKQAAPLPTSQGLMVGNTVFNIQLAGVASPTFNNPVTLEFVYDAAQLGAIDPATLTIAYYDTAAAKWMALASTVNPITKKVTAQTTHFTLFAIISLPTTADGTIPPPTATQPTSGTILGTSVGVYPNGTLLKAPNSPAVWHISGDKKHVIPSAAIFNTRFNWADIVYLPSSRQLDLYATGEPVAFAIGSLVKEEGKNAVYRMSAALGKQPILSAEIFLGRAYQWNQVIEVALGGLTNYPAQAYITETNNFYTGDVVKLATTGKIYQVETGAARPIPNIDILRANAFDRLPTRTVTASQFKQFVAGADIFYPDGTLVKGSSAAIYIISDGKKRAFASGADLDALLYNRKRIKIVADKVLAAIESIAPIKLAQKNIHTAAAE